MTKVIARRLDPDASRHQGTDNLDVLVCERIRERRTLLGLSIKQLSELLDISYSLARRINIGAARVPASMLFSIAEILGVNLDYFFEYIGKNKSRQVTPEQRLLLELARNFVHIADIHNREAILQLSRTLTNVRSDDDQLSFDRRRPRRSNRQFDDDHIHATNATNIDHVAAKVSSSINVQKIESTLGQIWRTKQEEYKDQFGNA